MSSTLPQISTAPGRVSLRRLAVPLTGLLAAQFSAALSGTIVATSVPTLVADLAGPGALQSWIIAATILGNTATTPVWGKLGDRVDRKTLLLVAIAVFGLGALVAMLSVDLTMLVLARAVMGVGVGGVVAGLSITVAGLVGARERGRVNALMSIIATTAQLAAPLLGGVLATAPLLGWRWSFLVIFLVIVVGFALIGSGLRLAPRDPRIRPLDLVGAVLITSTVTALLVFITTLGESGIGDPVALITGPTCAILFIVTVIVEKRAADPIIPLSLLRERTPALVVTAAASAGVTLFAGTVYASDYLQLGLGFSPALAGTTLVPMSIGSASAAWAAGRFMSRTARIKPVLVTGTASLLGGTLVLVAIGVAPVPFVIVGTVLVAAGLGMLLQNLVLAAQNSVDVQHVGTMSATVYFFMNLGGTIALVATGALLNAFARAATREGRAEWTAYTDGIPWVFAILAGVLVVGLLATLALPRTRLRESL